MKRAIVSILPLTLCVFGTAAFAQPTVESPTFSNAEMGQLEEGEILISVETDGGQTQGVVVALVEAPRDTVWAIIEDFAGQEDWIPDMYDAEVLSQSAGELTVRACMRVPFPLTDRRYTLRIRTDHRDVGGVATDVSTWEYVEGNMDANAGYWLVQDWGTDDDRALVVYAFEAASGIRGPDGIEERVTRRTMPGIIEGLRTQTRGRSAL